MSWRLPAGWPIPAVEPGFARFGLGPRLSRIASMVPQGSSVVDVGTDHALLPIALLGTGRCSNAIGIERNDEPFHRGVRNRDKFQVQVDLRRGVGLAIEPGEADVVVIAGLGGRNIAKVLRARDLFQLGIRRIIVQPNTDFEDVRHTLASVGYASIEECFVPDDDRFFLVIAAERAEIRELSAEQAFLGMIESDALFPAWSELTALLRRRRIG